jgi:drug/metabolite transporter (DMT)-like permease
MATSHHTAAPSRHWSPPRGAYLAWVFVCLAWGTTYLAIRIALETIPPMLMGAVRWLVAGVALSAVQALRGHALPGPRNWSSLAVIGVLMTGFGNGAVIWAEQTVPSGLAALLVASTPFWMVGLDRLGPGGAPVSMRKVAGLLVGFSGIVLLVWPDLSQGLRSASFAGVLATQIACLGWAAGSVYSRRLRVTGSVLGSSAMQMLFGGVALAAAGVGAGEWSSLAFNATTLGALVYLVVVGSIAGYSAYAYALQHLPIATVSLYAFINPIIAVVLGTLILAEPLSPRIFVAGTLVLTGMLVVRRG